ncbi:MAG: RidA family protein [Candidatus Rokubacteria bacterium]|nr:RidA family protein [Candidatus Rokubacteria bacterium]
MTASPALRDVPAGSYAFLPGIAPFSSGVVATPGHQVVHATLRAPIPWRDGFTLIDRHLGEQGRPRAALCAIELRSPAPFSFGGFDTFNAGYRQLLGEWGLLVDGENPIARTNVAPLVGAPAEPSLYAFGYTIAGATPRPTFVCAGAGELRERAAGAEGIVRHGETSPDAMREKAAFVMRAMQARLAALGGDWSDVTMIDLYTAQPIETFLADTVLRPAGPAAIHGVRWFPSRPPIAGLEYEMDLRGVTRELVL